MSDAIGSTPADPTEPLPPFGSASAAPAAAGRRSRLDVALVLAAVLAFGGVAFAGGRVTAAPSAGAAQDCGPGGGGGGGGAPGAPEAPNAPGGGGG